jgi:hypothetical protein
MATQQRGSIAKWAGRVNVKAGGEVWKGSIHGVYFRGLA